MTCVERQRIIQAIQELFDGKTAREKVQGLLAGAVTTMGEGASIADMRAEFETC